MTYPINEVDESLSFLAPKASRDSDLVLGMYQGPDVRDRLCCRHIYYTETIVEDGDGR